MVAWERRYKWKLIGNGHDRSHWGDENVLKLFYGDDYAIRLIKQKSLYCILRIGEKNIYIQYASLGLLKNYEQHTAFNSS